ncbi:MAG: Unknown protein [uncultured Aureispira sp.]|uniref:Disease resistance R13L4/SHOC-2-like LRR domain-containing protein n=1 Tax=uncultured Aureispira sp. TaxID=1331704 RepID=A0A6S6SDT1_9BACT|nr:MAG: Unknown protein [uncultured Aureispira sp.]
MVSEVDKIRQLLINDETNAVVALQLLKGQPKLQLQVEKEFSQVLEALGKKRLSSIPALLRKFRNQEKLSTKEKMALMAYPRLAEHLEVLDLADARLRRLPDCMRNLSNLKELNLRINKIGHFPNSMKEIKSLEKLYLDNNYLSFFPEVITENTNLLELRLATNKISTLPPSIGKLQRLIYLDLSNNRLLQLPKELSTLEQLEELLLDNNKLKKLPKDLGNLSKLKMLNIWGWKHQLCTLPESFQKLQNLEQLVLSSSEPIKNLSLLAACRNLKILNLGLSKTKDLPNEIGYLSGLMRLSIYGSDSPMTGLPDSIGNLRELTSLYLYDNHNLKDLPETLGNLSKLELLIVVGHSIPKKRQKEIEKILPHCTVKF